MATIKQLQHRLKQSQGRLQRLSGKKLDLGKKISALKVDDPSKAKFERQLAKTEQEILEAQSNCEVVEKELAISQKDSPPAAKEKKSKATSDVSARINRLERQIEVMTSLEKQLELAQRSNLDRFKQIQLQIRDLTKLTDRLLLVESQLRELQLSPNGPSDNSLSGDDMFGESDVEEEKNIFHPQSATTSLAGEPMSIATDGPWPWPETMSRFLKSWLVGRKWWGHEDWLGLLRQLSTRDFSDFAQEKYHGKIGAFLDEYRQK